MKFFKIILLLIICFLISIMVYYFYPEKKLPLNCNIDKILVLKSKRKLLVYEKNKLLKTYKISLGHNPVGKKEFEGDNKTPEGIYYIYEKNANSVCNKNLGISYPNKNDIAFARTKRKAVGGQIKIHGLVNGNGFIGKFHRWYDWTNGCIGVTNAEIDELYKHVQVGTPLEIRP